MVFRTDRQGLASEDAEPSWYEVAHQWLSGDEACRHPRQQVTGEVLSLLVDQVHSAGRTASQDTEMPSCQQIGLIYEAAKQGDWRTTRSASQESWTWSTIVQ